MRRKYDIILGNRLHVDPAYKRAFSIPRAMTTLLDQPFDDSRSVFSQEPKRAKSVEPQQRLYLEKKTDIEANKDYI